MSKIVDEEGNVVSAVIRVGKNGDYVNLDALVMDATDNLIDEIYQEDSELVAIVGRKLLADKYFPIVNKDQPNSERSRLTSSSARNASATCPPCVCRTSRRTRLW
jgi:hypothetical protein